MNYGYFVYHIAKMNHWKRRIDHLDKIANIKSSNLIVLCGYSYMAIMYMHTYMQCIFQYSIIYGIPFS